MNTNGSRTQDPKRHPKTPKKATQNFLGQKRKNQNTNFNQTKNNDFIRVNMIINGKELTNYIH